MLQYETIKKVEIWGQNLELKCWNFSAKCQIDQNVAIWVQNYESVKTLKIKDKIGYWPQYWYFSAKD